MNKNAEENKKTDKLKLIYFLMWSDFVQNLHSYHNLELPNMFLNKNLPTVINARLIAKTLQFTITVKLKLVTNFSKEP
jgi:hypothetical protein